MQGQPGGGVPPILVRGRCLLERARDSLVEGWAEFLDRFSWEGFWTLTFEQDYSVASARRAFVRWASRFTLSEPGALSFIGFLEWGRRTPKVPHIHALTRLERCDRRVMWSYWFPHYGRAQSRAFQGHLGGRYYLAKYCTKEVVEPILDERITDQLCLPTLTKST